MIWLCCTCTLVVDSPEGEDVGDDHRLVGCRVDALDPLGVEVLEEELLPHLAPETHTHIATLSRNLQTNLRFLTCGGGPQRGRCGALWPTPPPTSTPAR